MGSSAKTEGWKSVLKADPTDWLLEEDNPSVRYFTLKDLMDLPDNHPDVLAAKRGIPTSKVVTKIFSKQSPKGYWESPERPYKPKVQVHLLADHDPRTTGPRQERRANPEGLRLHIQLPA